MKKTAYLLVVAVLLCGASAFAQGAFNDVPTDHWAYDAVNQLQKDGIVIGYPDGTYGGKRAMSRYEFAVAIARILPMIAPAVTGDWATKADLAQFVKKSDLPDFSKFATKDDVAALRKLIDEFRDELAALGVDVDALKRDLAALAARVEALEAEMKRVRLTGNVNIFGVATNADKGVVIDQDSRESASYNDGGRENTLIRSIGYVQDFDLNIVGRVSDTVTANATINYGNYLNYVRYVDDFIGGVRPTDKNDLQGAGIDEEKNFVDGFFPYYLYIDWAICKGNVQVGRFPLQFTPYTLRKIDVDTYTNILKTDDGNYPVDGIKVAYDFGGVDLTLYAAKHDQNDYLLNGLTGQPFSGPYQAFGTFMASNQSNPEYDLLGTDASGVGGLEEIVSQSAGARVLVGTPWKGTLGLTFYQAWSQDAWLDEANYDQARVYGADLNIPIGAKWAFMGSWTRSDTLASDRSVGVPDIDDDNTAWDVKLAGSFGRLGLGLGYKEIEYNFAAAGYWDKIGRWANPTNVKGFYADLCFPFSKSFSFMAEAEFLEMIDTLDATHGGVDDIFADDEITKAQAGIKWAFSKNNTFDASYQWVQWEPADGAFDEGTESYLTLAWAHQISANAGFRVGYQFINWDGGDDAFNLPYGDDYRGGLGVVQFGVSF